MASDPGFMIARDAGSPAALILFQIAAPSVRYSCFIMRMPDFGWKFRVPAGEVCIVQKGGSLDGDVVFQFVLGFHHHFDDDFHLFRVVFRHLTQFVNVQVQFVAHVDHRSSFRNIRGS
jgi:hypothetical protein